MTLAVCSGPALEIPQRVAPVDPRLFADSEDKAAGDEAGEAEPGGIAMQRGRREKKHSAERAGAHAQRTEIFAPLRSEMRPAQGRQEKGSDVLDADDQAGEGGVITHSHVDIFGQDGQREADGEIDDEGERGKTDDLPGAAVGRHGGRGDYGLGSMSQFALFRADGARIPCPHYIGFPFSLPDTLPELGQIRNSGLGHCGLRVREIRVARNGTAFAEHTKAVEVGSFELEGFIGEFDWGGIAEARAKPAP